MIDYSAKWYEENYHPKAKWYGKLNTPDQLVAFYYVDCMPHLARFKFWFSGVDLKKGNLLELGFNTGKTVYYLAKTFPGLIIDGIDFSREVLPIGEMLMEMFDSVRDLRLGDCSQIPKPDDAYQFVTALDLFEHLPEDVYQKTIDEINRVICANGLVFVYTGQEIQEEHIHIIPPEKVVVDFLKRRFLPIHIHGDFLILRKLAPMEYPEINEEVYRNENPTC